MSLSKAALTAGAVLGGVVVGWQVVSVAGGWFAAFVPVATLVQIGILLALLRYGREDHGYLQQVWGAFVASLVGSAAIFVGSWVTLTSLFPDRLLTLRETTAETMRQQGASPTDVTSTLSLMTPEIQAAMGVVGTLGTGLLVGLLGALVWRKRA